MKRLILCLLLTAAGIQLQAQDSATYKAKYDRLSKVGGPAGVGIETVLEDWEKVSPTDRDYLAAKFSFCLTKSRRDTVITLSQERYLGQKPMFELQDSLGKKVRYFSDTAFNDSLYFKALDAIDCAIELYPKDLDLRMGRIGAMLLHGKEDQDEVRKETLSLLDFHAKNNPGWEDNGNQTAPGVFEEQIQDCCYELYNVGSESSYEAFKAVSEKASKMFPANTAFLNNLGVYWMIAKNNPQKAIGYYKKVMKLEPDEPSAKKNMQLAQKAIDSKKQKKK